MRVRRKNDRKQTLWQKTRMMVMIKPANCQAFLENIVTKRQNFNPVQIKSTFSRQNKYDRDINNVFQQDTNIGGEGEIADSLHKNKILGGPKFKALADDKINVTSKHLQTTK